MPTPAILAACGLLFALTAQSETLPAKTRESADQATWAISDEVARAGLNEEVSKLVWTLAAHLKAHPEEIIPVAEEVGPECKEFVRKP